MNKPSQPRYAFPKEQYGGKESFFKMLQPLLLGACRGSILKPRQQRMGRIWLNIPEIKAWILPGASKNCCAVHSSHTSGCCWLLEFGWYKGELQCQTGSDPWFSSFRILFLRPTHQCFIGKLKKSNCRSTKVPGLHNDPLLFLLLYL